jgi:hypothetical protein
VAGPGEARQGEAWRGQAGRGEARRGKELLNIKFKKEDIYESFIM